MLHTLSRSLRENKGPALVTVLLSALEVVFEIVIPLFMSNLIDFGIEGGSMAAVWKFGAFLLLLAAFQLATGVLAARIAARASVGFGANLREDMYNNVQTFAFSNIDKFSTASIVTRLTTDVTNVQNAFQMLMRMAIRSPVMLVFSMIVSFRISRDISMTFLIILPILAVALFFIIRSVFPIFTRVFRTYDELNNVVQENVRGIRVVKSFNQEQHEIRKFGAISERIYKDFSKGERLITLNAPLMQSCIYACMIIISWLGAKAIIASGNDPALGLTTGNLTALITYAMQILSSLMMLSMVFAMLTISLSSARRIAEVIEEKTDIQNPEHPVMAVRDGAIDFDHVSFVYASKADKKVLDDIDLHIRSGETIGVIGGTGASKSSLVQLIPRLYDVTGGRLTLGGVDVRDYDLETLRNAVAMVLQKNELFSGTIAENLRWGNENATDEELRHACVLACADEFISAMPDGYDTYIEHVGTAGHQLVAAVQVDVQPVVGHAVLHKAHQAGQVDLAVLAFQKFFQIIVAQRRVFDINLADDADLDLRHAGDGNGRVVGGNVVEPALHVMGGVVLVVADPALYRRDPLLGHGVGVAPVVLVGVGLAAQGDQHIAVKDRRNDLAQQRHGQRQTAALFQTGEVQRCYGNIAIRGRVKQLCKSYQVLCSRCRKLHFPSVDTGASNAQLTSKGSL